MSRIVSSLKFPGNRHRKHAATLALACALSLAALPSARAVDITWDGGGASPLWTDLGNWSGGPPAPFNDAFIGSGFASGTDLVLNGPSTIKSLTINTATAFSIGRTVINQNIYLALDTGNLTRQNVSGAEAEQFLDIDVILGANGVWNIAGSNSLTVRGYINEFINTTPSLTKTGTGTLVLRATSQFALSGHYDGTTSLNQGRIRLVNNGGIGEGTVTVADGATLEMQSHPNGPDSPLRLTGFGVDLLFPVGSHDGALKNISGDSAWDGPITLLSDSSINVEADSLTLNGGIGDGAGTFELIKFGGGDLILPVASTHGGGTTVNGGRLIISNGGALGSAGTTSVGINGILGLKGDISVPRPISLSGANLGGTASLQNLEGNNTITGSITLVGNSAISTAATTTLTLTGLISDNGNARTLTKLGGGTLILNHTNSFTGGMIVSEGTLQLALLTAIASGTTTTVESGASVELPGGLTVTRLVQLNGGGFSSKGALSSVGNNTWNGGIVLQSNSSVGAEADGTFTISGAVSGAFTLSKVGPGTLVLNNAANSFGNLNINAGILAVSTPNGIPPASTVAVTATGAAIELSGNATINRPLSLKGDGISDGGALHNVAGSNTWSGNLALPSAASVRVDTATALVLSGAISGSGALTKSGAGMLTLTGANTYTGVTTLEEGVLRLQNSSALGSTPNLHVLAGAAVEIQNDIDVPRPLIVSGSSIQSTGALRSLAGANTFSGPLTLENHLTIGVDAGSTLTLGGALSDGAGVFTLTKVGAGTLVLGNAANTYDGGTFVNGGTLSTSSDAGLGAASSQVTLNNGGKLVITSNTTSGRTFNLNTGSLQVAAGATLTYVSATVNGGFLRGPGAHAIGANSTFSGVTALSGNTITQSFPTTLSNFTNSGSFISNALLTWDGGYNTSAGTLTINDAFNITAFENTGIVNVNNGGLLSNTANNFVSGGGSRITVNPSGQINLNSTAMDLNGALLINNGTITGATNVNYGSLAKGSGVYGAVNVLDGGKFSPGNSPGFVTTGSVSWNPGGNYTVEMSDALGAPGTGWDLWNIAGDLLTNASTDPSGRFTISLASLAGNSPGFAANFDNTRDYSWLILRADDGILGFDPAQLALDVSGFRNNLGGGHFALESSSTDLYVRFAAVPEPAAIGLFVVAALWSARRRRF